jgi:fructokinase
MIVVAGEALIDVMDHGPAPGGSSANVAVTLARLGHPVRLLARLSQDAYGQQIRAHLAANGVDLSCVVNAEQPTALAVAPIGAGGYEFHLDGAADWQWRQAEVPSLPPTATALHSGSLALAMPPGAQILEGLLARERSGGAVTVSIDLNLRPSALGDVTRERARVARQIAYAHIVKASEADLGWLYPGVPAPAILASWRDAGVACGVVTHGGAGAYLLAPNGVAYRRTARPVEVIDAIGAGDAFTGGMLTALADLGALGDRPRERLAGIGAQEWLSVLDQAGQIAAITCTRPGADPPTRAELTSAHACV